MSSGRLLLAVGAFAGALAVALGAFGAHGLKHRLSADLMAVYQTAVLYHFLHALALVAIGLAAIHFPHSALLRWAGWAMIAGVCLFSGSLYGIAFGGWRALGAVAPLGGTALICGWLLLATAALRG